MPYLETTINLHLFLKATLINNCVNHSRFAFSERQKRSSPHMCSERLHRQRGGSLLDKFNTARADLYHKEIPSTKPESFASNIAPSVPTPLSSPDFSLVSIVSYFT